MNGPASRPSGTRLQPVQRRIWIYGVAAVVVIAAILFFLRGETWRGIVVAPEDRCSSYSPDDYRYSQSVEAKIVDEIGKIYSPYTGRCFNSVYETEIEHIVARSEAHDSGLCAESEDTRRAFANDLENLTLASSRINRQKGAKDAVEWLPDENRCWFANRIVQVRLKHGLTIDREEADALELVLSACESTEMVIRPCPSAEDAESKDGIEVDDEAHPGAPPSSSQDAASTDSAEVVQ